MLQAHYVHLYKYTNVNYCSTGSNEREMFHEEHRGDVLHVEHPDHPGRDQALPLGGGGLADPLADLEGHLACLGVDDEVVAVEDFAIQNF